MACMSMITVKLYYDENDMLSRKLVDSSPIINSLILFKIRLLINL